MHLKIKRLTDTAIIPQYAHPTDSGMDLHYDGESFMFHSRMQILLSTGIAIQLPPGTEAQIRGRSGLAAKWGIGVVQGIGTIDEGYTGEIKVLLINHGIKAVQIKRGDRIAQMVIVPVLRLPITEAYDLGETDRGANGFGSTGMNCSVEQNRF